VKYVGYVVHWWEGQRCEEIAGEDLRWREGQKECGWRTGIDVGRRKGWWRRLGIASR